jgi:hypothetical protein
MSTVVSRTVCQVANFATFSLFATALMIVVTNGARLPAGHSFCGGASCAGQIATLPTGQLDPVSTRTAVILASARGA